MTMPAIDMRRVYLVARRDFLGYIKTWGFWVSFFLPFVFIGLGFLFTTLDWNVEPVRYEAILDQTGEHEKGIKARIDAKYVKIEKEMLDKFAKVTLGQTDQVTVKKIHRENGFKAAQDFIDTKLPGVGARLSQPPRKTIFVEAPAQSIEGLQPYLKGERTLSHEGKTVNLGGVLHIHNNENTLHINYWSSNINNFKVREVARGYFRNLASAKYLATGNLTNEGLAKARRENIQIESFDPTKSAGQGEGGQAVTVIDQIPYGVAAVLCLLLWLTVFSGSYMLLTSMLEEKLNKLMEMMLASTRFSEIIFGKLIGVAALTIAAMLPYILIGFASVAGFILLGPADVAAGLASAFTAKLMFFFVVFLVLGYIFYGALFIALGALAESMQDAQTLTTPIMLLLTSCIMVVPLGFRSPDSPLLDAAAWFPLSAPFAAIMRLPSDPPWWELSLQAGFVLILSLGVIWLAGRIFRFGILSGAGVKGAKNWFKRTILRRKSS